MHVLRLFCVNKALNLLSYAADGIMLVDVMMLGHVMIALSSSTYTYHTDINICKPYFVRECITQ